MKIYEKYLNEKSKDINWYAKEIENMDMNVEKGDRAFFTEELENALRKVDPKNKLSISAAVKKLGLSKAKDLYTNLLDFNYEE